MKRLRKQRPIPGIQLPGRMDTITDALCPTVPRLTHPTAIRTNEEPPVLFSMHELITAVRSLPNGKAPGPDGLSNEIIKVAVSIDPSHFLHTYNASLASGKFPDRWKVDKLVLLPKPGKSLENPSAYRPICLLDGCVPWDHILRAAWARNVPGSLLKMMEAYLCARSIELPGVDGKEGRRKETNCGVPQGSVLEPYLCNLFSDLVRIALPEDVELIAFADDMALISTASVSFLLEERLEAAYSIDPPSKLFLARRGLKGKTTQEVKEETMRKWLLKVENAKKEEWTRTLIRDVRKWVTRKHGTMGFHLTQILS
ncbi:hypothetical protein QTP88_026423 [Uroleucon formosanum]